MVAAMASITNETTINVILRNDGPSEAIATTTPPIPNSIVCPKNQANAKFNEMLEIEINPSKTHPTRWFPILCTTKTLVSNCQV